jgi:NDP-4-keto-2,6-dideoxyhexose 3-C-methyltransferase
MGMGGMHSVESRATVGDMPMPSVHKKIAACRICGNTDLQPILDFGVQALSSRFPRAGEADPPLAPLTLVRCTGCQLVQLLHSVAPGEMYTLHYGYKSGTNATMREHLARVAAWVEERLPLKARDIVVDIGCNDGTLLKSYSTAGLRRVGIDPLAEKFKDQYPPDVRLHEGFFSAAAARALCGGERAEIVTAIAMFNHVEAPLEFFRAVESVLAPDGLWVLEQSYLPTMLETNGFDAVCHEHLTYYSLRQIEWLAEATGLRVFDVELNACNGGSFRLAICRKDASHRAREDRIGPLRRLEEDMGLGTPAPYDAFQRRIEKIPDDLLTFIATEQARGKRFYLYGASTKGNTLLQYCKLDARKIIAAAERNPEKWGCRTPLTGIPILSESECRAAKPDYFLVLPWHFRDEFVEREAEFLEAGGKLIFPLPQFEVVQAGER